jgi:hypothetical protein
MSTAPSIPTQVRHPWRASVRTWVVTFVTLLPAVPLILHEFGLESTGWALTIASFAAALTRVIAIPAVNAELTKRLNLGATPRT